MGLHLHLEGLAFRVSNTLIAGAKRVWHVCFCGAGAEAAQKPYFWL
jgi:hypothetical protein